MRWLGRGTAIASTSALFFQVTAVFLFVFVVQLLIYGFHELTEANLFPGSEALHAATEPYGPDGVYGQYLSYMLVLLPLGWLAFAGFTKRGPAPQRSSGGVTGKAGPLPVLRGPHALPTRLSARSRASPSPDWIQSGHA